MSYLAWATRGLFELALWADYCSQSPANALRFVQDTIRDHVGLIDALKIEDRAIPGSDTHAGFADLKDLLMRVSSNLGMANLDGKYIRLAKAAKEIGACEMYQRINTALSKFVHPTALVINSPIVDEMLDTFVNMFVQISNVCAAEVFEIVGREQKKIRIIAKGGTRESAPSPTTLKR